MWTVLVVLMVVGAAVAGAAVVRARRRGDATARAIGGLARSSRRQRGRRGRGSGQQFGRTPIKKYGDEHHGPADSHAGGDWGDSGSSGGNW